MATIDIVVTDLTFPDKLEDKYCKFRPLISLRYTDSQDKTNFAREALPGLGPRDYWECEKANKKKDNYVRSATDPKVDMTKIPTMQRKITFTNLDIKTLADIEIELFDIDIKVGWEKVVSKGLQMLPPDALALINPGAAITLNLVKDKIQQASGQKIPDLQQALINKLIGKEDGAARTIWTQSQDLTNPAPATQTLTLTGPGKQGNFSMTLTLTVSP